MIKFEEIRKSFDGRPLEAIEGEIIAARTSMNGHFENMIHALFYLEKTGRFRENKFYRDMAFKDYILDRYNLRFETYLKSRRALITFPEETEALGVGLVSKVLTRCGQEKAHEAIQEIKKLKDEKKRFDRKAFEKIIFKYIPPVKKRREKELKEQKEQKFEKCKNCIVIEAKLRAIIKEKDKRIKDLEAQNEKLKATVLRDRERFMPFMKFAEALRDVGKQPEIGATN